MDTIIYHVWGQDQAYIGPVQVSVMAPAPTNSTLQAPPDEPPVHAWIRVNRRWIDGEPIDLNAAPVEDNPQGELEF